MKDKVRKGRGLCAPLAVVAAVLWLGATPPCLAQDDDEATASEDTARKSPAIEEIVVTAQRREEFIQDVPISISVFSQQQLDDRNIVNAFDLATFTPSLTANPRFGEDNTTFAIRGFTQELRTSPSVGVFFADVVAPRGGGSITAGDGAGPGSFFDLENVQVLKGPQGTLFGRNTTGGAVLLVPRKPTDEWEGYVEGSVGNFDMMRAQGVLNAPLHERVRMRVGFDRQLRDGYLNNTSGVGPSDLSDVDYIAARASLVLDVTDSIENYSIFSYLHSRNNGGLAQVFACNPNALLNAFSGPCEEQLASLGDDFYEVRNPIPNPKSKIEQWQIINTSTWEVNDLFTVKNIFSFANLETELRSAVFGTDFYEQTPTGRVPLYFSSSGLVPGFPTNSQDSLVEELQFQGNAFDERLEWQGGFYYELSKPSGRSGSRSVNFISCDLATLDGDPSDFRCNNVTGLPLGAVSNSLGTIKFENKAVYGQSSFDIVPDLLRATGGIRYTWDDTHGKADQVAYQFDKTPDGSFVEPSGAFCAAPSATYPDCNLKLKQSSDAPTWLIGLDVRPIEDAMFYAKWVRGYRQGSVNIFGVDGLNTFGPEKVDTYEIGAKTLFTGPFEGGSFNIAGFYNDFRDQQIQLGVITTTFVPTTAIVNAGSSRIWGIESEANVEIIEGLRLSGTYTYLNTKLKKLDIPTDLPSTVLAVVPSAVEGDSLSFSPEHQLVCSASLLLPFVPSNLGDVIVALTFVYNDNQRAVASSESPFAIIPHYELLNLNLNWNRVADLPVDFSFFVTNVLEEKYWTYLNGTYGSLGFDSRVLAQPRMFGARLRYDFNLS